jgi:hypothetical protein
MMMVVATIRIEFDAILDKRPKICQSFRGREPTVT